MVEYLREMNHIHVQDLKQSPFLPTCCTAVNWSFTFEKCAICSKEMQHCVCLSSSRKKVDLFERSHSPENMQYTIYRSVQYCDKYVVVDQTTAFC